LDQARERMLWPSGMVKWWVRVLLESLKMNTAGTLGRVLVTIR
jgi:hypothetical protein